MSHVDIEQGNHVEIDDVSSEGSSSLSDADVRSCYSQFYEYSTFGCVSDEDMSGSDRASSVSECSVEMVEVKVHCGEKVERECSICRICHLGLESGNSECGIPIALGCSCKGDLGAAHRNCAETWFKIKGNKTCEICHSVARNVSGPNVVESIEQPNDATLAFPPAAVSALALPTETRSFWQGRRFLNFLLVCMVLAFVISWLFRFNVPS